MTLLKNLIRLALVPVLFLATLATTGCASGGFKMTREFARFINSKNIVIRIVLYLVLGFVFAVTLILDMVIFNTMDFWEGRVSDGSYMFKDGNQLYAVQHFYSDENRTLRNTRIQIYEQGDGEPKTLTKTVLLTETVPNQIKVFENGRLIAEAVDINDLAAITRYDGLGNKIGTFPVHNYGVVTAR